MEMDEWMDGLMEGQTDRHIFVGVEVLRPNQPMRVVLSTVILPNHTFSWTGLVLLDVNQYLCTFFCQKHTTALLESAEGRE